MLWTEKYRPKTREEFMCPPHLTSLLNSKTHQHLLLYGPPGSGKTTFAHLLASKDVLELNASDERGINIVRTKIKTYAEGIKKDKTIILDECDNLTTDAQQCLRRIIEDFSSTTRFIFITNYLSRIIAPLKSRLLKIRFDSKPENYVYLVRVGELNGIRKSDEFYQNLFLKCGMDLRRSLNVLQGVAPFINDIENVDDFVGIIPDSVIDRFYNLENKDIYKFTQDFIRESYSFHQFILQLNERCGESDGQFAIYLSEIEKKCVVGCSTDLLMLSLCCKKMETRIKIK